MKAFVDSDVLIWHLRGERKALNLLKNLRDKENCALWTGAMQFNGKIYTLNTKHYPMPDVAVKHAWVTSDSHKS